MESKCSQHGVRIESKGEELLESNGVENESNGVKMESYIMLPQKIWDSVLDFEVLPQTQKVLTTSKSSVWRTLVTDFFARKGEEEDSCMLWS